MEGRDGERGGKNRRQLAGVHVVRNVVRHDELEVFGATFLDDLVEHGVEIDRLRRLAPRLKEGLLW